jgi:Bacterial PH domain
MWQVMHSKENRVTAPSADPTVREGSGRTDTEVDVWWGSYAGRAMVPSFGVCIVLTGLIYLGVRWWVPERGWLQLTFFALVSAVWLVQLTRWAYRFFTWNYRLTTRFLYVEYGPSRHLSQRWPVRDVERMEARYNLLERMLGIGDLWVWFDEATKPPAILLSLKSPQAVAETIRAVVRKARDNIN